jgi:hypothetical protein
MEMAVRLRCLTYSRVVEQQCWWSRVVLLLSEQSVKSKHQEPLNRSESDRAAGLPSCVDCADHRKARKSCQIVPLGLRVLTTTSCLCCTIRVVPFYSNRWSCNSRLVNVHETTSFALGLMKDSARESLSCQRRASQLDFVRELASVLKDANLSAFEH